MYYTTKNPGNQTKGGRTMERRKCRRCGHPMTRLITKIIEPGGSRWEAWYSCLSCCYETATVTAKSQTAAEDGLERLMDRVDRAYETAAGRSAAPRKPQTAEADRALAAYGLYCQLCEALTGKPIAKLDELLTAAQKAKRELAAYKGAGQRYETEIARLKQMAAEDILRAALSGYPCDSCINNTLDVLCDCEECADCERHCVCYECHDSESFAWRGGK